MIGPEEFVQAFCKERVVPDVSDIYLLVVSFSLEMFVCFLFSRGNNQ